MISQCFNSERSLRSSLARIRYIWSQNTLKLLYTRFTGAGLERFYAGTTKTVYYIWMRHSLEIGWTEPERLHDAKSEWRWRVTITGY